MVTGNTRMICQFLVEAYMKRAVDCPCGSDLNIYTQVAGKVEVDGLVLEHQVRLLIALDEISRLLGDRVHKRYNVTRHM